jgi:hypothetical protein
MKEQLISFETAKLAKEKGFNENVDYSYVEDTTPTNICNSELGVPTQALLQKWLREKHKIEVLIEATTSQLNFAEGYNYYIWNRNTGYEFWSEPTNCPVGEFISESYEGALEIGLQEALKQI